MKGSRLCDAWVLGLDNNESNGIIQLIMCKKKFKFSNKKVLIIRMIIERLVVLR